MAEARTRVNKASVDGFLNSIADAQIRDDCRVIAGIMQQATKAQPEMWGSSIVGFGRRTCTYANGRQADWMLTAFAPRKQNITLYLFPDFEDRDDLMVGLGKHSSGKGCLYIKRLSDVHVPTLKKLVKASVQHGLKTTAPAT